MVGLAVIGVVALMIVTSILNGYVLSVLWGWFFVPTLELPPLTIVQAIGIAMVVNYHTSHRGESASDKDKSAAEKLIEGIVYAIIYPFFALLFGWVVHLFM